MNILYVAGPGDVTQDLRDWAAGAVSRYSVAHTYSSEVFRYCSDHKINFLCVSANLRSDSFVVSSLQSINLPKRTDQQGVSYHIEQLRYGLKLFGKAKKMQASVAIIDSGSLNYWVLCLFRIARIKTIPKFHNALWPMGYPPSGFKKLRLYFGHTLPLRLSCTQALAVSTECVEQVQKVLGRRAMVKVFSPVYNRASLMPHIKKHQPSQHRAEFKVAFVGRMEVNKGIRQVLNAITILSKRAPKGYSFHFYGDGSEREFIDTYREKNPRIALNIYGNFDAHSVLEAISNSDVVLVPTTTQFAEALAKSAVEGALLSIPVIATSVVPAISYLTKSIMPVPADDPLAIADAIHSLRVNPSLYEKYSAGDEYEKNHFMNSSNSLYDALKKLLL